ncbi:helix-turn-helix transcriptional regulator [Roseomonas terrae]|uniref:Helix-turn-helix transcriptional regulator n=1 Tax=Neoroseomonas terrae TaxID=424799 RepID=A0ABS5EK16_9PROT|nr:helix-turn-helix transcriptional regulator [Neoroseomonas terrae]MBR0651369.1 helix-turn-helix transcriptional regulator [Neoroseomonas terrae]
MTLQVTGAIIRVMSIPERPSDAVDGAATRLRAAREVLGVQQQDMARACGAEPQRWSNWESARHLPDALVMVRAHQLYGISLDWVYAADPKNLPGRLLDGLRARFPELLGLPPLERDRRSSDAA